MTPTAVPRPAVAKAPALQWVMTLECFLSRAAPSLAMALAYCVRTNSTDTWRRARDRSMPVGLAGIAVVVDVKPSQRQPRGIVSVKLTTRNQHNEIVLSEIARLVVPRRPEKVEVPG